MRKLRISFTVDEVAAGTVLADLADKVQDLDFNVIEEIKKPSKKNGYSVNGIILASIAAGATSSAEMKANLQSVGYAPGSLNSALYQLMKKKQVKRVGPNEYALKTPLKSSPLALPAPTKPAGGH